MSLCGGSWLTDTHGSHDKDCPLLNGVNHSNASVHASQHVRWDWEEERGRYRLAEKKESGGSFDSVYSVETGTGVVLVVCRIILHLGVSVLDSILDVGFYSHTSAKKAEVKSTASLYMKSGMQDVKGGGGGGKTFRKR